MTFRKIYTLLFCFSLLFLLSASAFAQDKEALKGKKVLFVWGGWDGHEPKQCCDKLVPWLKSEGAEVIVSNTLDSYTDSELMSSIDLIIQTWTMGKLSGEQEAGLLNAIRNGAGIAGWHGGLGDAFRENTEYQFMVGGQWVAHPGGHVNYQVNIIDRRDAVTKGIKDFPIQSEQYYVQVDPNVKVLATTTFSGEHNSWIDGAVIPVVWKKTYGKGRVFYCSLIHSAKELEIPQVMKIMQRGIRWAALSKYAPEEKWLSPVYAR